MTREEALKNLNLPLEADADAIEKAYQRLVRRYPPEFQPDRFRIIDESYRQLTSLPEMLEKLLSPSVGNERFDTSLMIFDPAPPVERLDQAVAEARAEILAQSLWRSTSPKQKPKGKAPF